MNNVSYIDTLENNESMILSLHNDKFSMNLSLCCFFPTSKKNILNLLKNNVTECEHVNENLKQIILYLKNAIDKSTSDIKELKKLQNNLKYVNEFMIKNKMEV